MKENKQVTDTNGDVAFTITPLSVKQIARLYGVSLKTLYKWLAPFSAEIGEKNGRFYTNAQVKIIIQKLGIPAEIIKG